MQTPRRWSGQGNPVWGAVPPPPRVKKYGTLHVVSTAPIDCLILSAQLEETFTHYVDSRTVFCTGPEHGCWLAHDQVGKPRYGAWLAVMVGKVRVTWLLRLTSVAVSIEPRLRQLAGDLRGRTLRVWRLHNSEQSEMHAKLIDGSPVAGELPEVPDMRFCLERMLCANDRPNGPLKGKWRSTNATMSDTAGVHPQLGAR